MKGEGVLGDLGYTTTREAILELTSRLETSAKTIEQLQKQKPETIQDINKELGIE